MIEFDAKHFLELWKAVKLSPMDRDAAGKIEEEISNMDLSDVAHIIAALRRNYADRF
jgi:hypothetical protein